jgi:hypothetical protein
MVPQDRPATASSAAIHAAAPPRPKASKKGRPLPPPRRSTDTWRSSRSRGGPSNHVERAIGGAGPWVERRTGLTLAESQTAAVRLALTAKVLVITGGPGVGKTTIVNSILRIPAPKGVRILTNRPRRQAHERGDRHGGADHPPTTGGRSEDRRRRVQKASARTRERRPPTACKAG